MTITDIGDRSEAIRALRARWAIAAVFAGNGLAIASLAVRNPSLKLDHDLSAVQLGAVSALFGVVAVIVMQVAGRLTARLGSAALVRAATVVLPLALLGVGLAGGLPQLGAAMIVMGAAHGLLDVSMNAHGVAVERALHRPIMNGCHAAWSIGAVTGSLTGGAAAEADLPLAHHYLYLAAVLVPGALLVGRWLLPATVDRRPRVEDRPPRAGFTRRLLILGAMGAGVLTCEGAVITWSGVYLHENLGASLGTAALGYVAFNICQTSLRLVGDRLSARHPARILIGVGTLAAAGGLIAVVLSPWPALAIAGFAVVGLGLATPLPVLYSVVGHLGAGGAGAAGSVARFTTMTYSGVLLGPALIGGTAELIGLSWTLAALIPVLCLVARGARLS
ncbi:MFS transporter [Phytohabitans sp. ZYX-F-186]|uniref:MFS transporter n=1 Tax=Phytohabitans maris TaxID=3071409 RepID=A0ABU0ZBF5_9ACTN|nr:MFS transporter [Phytohabitans sp. ZYX-F-186]MDQ7904398.1 MFS transporter [Phytohabitans sp. ZYX-F-186]